MKKFFSRLADSVVAEVGWFTDLVFLPSSVPLVRFQMKMALAGMLITFGVCTLQGIRGNPAIYSVITAYYALAFSLCITASITCFVLGAGMAMRFWELVTGGLSQLEFLWYGLRASILSLLYVPAAFGLLELYEYLAPDGSLRVSSPDRWSTFIVLTIAWSATVLAMALIAWPRLLARRESPPRSS